MASRHAADRAHFRIVLPDVKTLRLILLTAVGVASAGLGLAQVGGEEVQTGTARDVIFRADTAYNAGRYAESVAGYEAYLRDFGNSAEAKPALPHVYYNLSAALLQVQKFDAALAAIETGQALEETTPDQQENLSFWRGVSLTQLGENAKARQALEEFIEKFPRSRRRQDAALLAATALMLEGKMKEAAAAFNAMRKNPESLHRGRAVVLELHSLIETGQDDAALELLAQEGPRQEHIAQIATFQTLAMALGEKYLANEKPREAIRALQTLWTRDRLVAHQEGRLADIQEQLTALEASSNPDIF